MYIWNKSSGARISTYVLPGEKGSGVVCLNGAAARSCQVGDEVIISLSKYVTNDEMYDFSPYKIAVTSINPDLGNIDF